MGAPDVLAQLSALGVTLTRDGDSLVARPRSALTDEARAMIRAHKTALLEALARPADPPPPSHLTTCAAAAVAPPGAPWAGSMADASPGAEARRQRVLAMLADRQAVRYALLVDGDAEPEAVILALAIRGAIADGAAVTCELRVPREKFDPFLLLDLVARHGATVH